MIVSTLMLGSRSLDEAFCRAALPRVSRTFAINIGVLGHDLRGPVRVAYLLCRMCDAIEDSWPGDAAAFRARFARFREAIEGSPVAALDLATQAGAIAQKRADLELVANGATVLRCFGALEPGDREAIRECLRTMSEGMCRYRSRAAERPGAPYLDDQGELHDYCWSVAGCVGRMLTQLFGRRRPAATPALERERLERAPAVGEALQLTNIILDWPIDVRRGRCYVPAAWLRELNLTPAELVDRPRPEVDLLVDRLESLAGAARSQVPDYLDLIPTDATRFRLFCLWPTLWAAASLRQARRHPGFPWGPERPRISRARLWSLALGSLVIVGQPDTIRRRYFGESGSAPVIPASRSWATPPAAPPRAPR